MTWETAEIVNDGRNEALTWLASVFWAPTLTGCRTRYQARSSSIVGPSGRGPDEIKAYMKRLEGLGFSGALFVARGGNVLVQSPHGVADQATQRSWAADTVFDVGSCTKQFTATAILALEADGKVLVQDPIAKYLPAVPADKTGITLHHLLTHTAGLQSEFGGDHDAVSRDALVARVMEAPLRAPPGERHAYSNVGYSLLAAIVERVSGASIDRYLRERLFRRAGMTSSGAGVTKNDSGSAPSWGRTTVTPALRGSFRP